MKGLSALALVAALTGCAIGYERVRIHLPESQVERIKSALHPLMERAFCLSPNGIYNVVDGSITGVMLPICACGEPGTIVMHTHPLWGEPGANFVDGWAFDVNHFVSGCQTYGVVGFGWMWFYRRA